MSPVAVPLTRPADSSDRLRGAAGPCPNWCTVGPHGPLDDIHGSEHRHIAVATPDHICGRLDDPHAVGPCPDDIQATILSVGRGPAEIVLAHGDDVLPHMTPDAAEELAYAILRLARQAKQG